MRKVHLIVFTFFILLLGSRRGHQLIYPSVWTEDGSVTLYQFLNDGLISIFYHVNGYIVLVPKIISGISYLISFYYYPEISTVLTWALIAAIGCAISFSPTTLPNKFALAVATFIVPTDPEAFGLPAYTFWWTSFLLVLLCFWRYDARTIRLRMLYLVPSALSSPFIVVLLPVLFVRTLICPREAKRDEILCFVTGAALAAVQLICVKVYALNRPTASGQAIDVIAQKFFGGYFFINYGDAPGFATLCGYALIAFLLFACLRTRLNYNLTVVTYLIFAVIALSAARETVTNLHPASIGPRYFYYPYVFISWAFIILPSCIRARWASVAASAALLLAFVNTLPVYYRKHVERSWRLNIRNCLAYGGNTYPFNIQSDGSAGAAWQIMITGEQCRRALDTDVLYSLTGPQFPELPFSVKGAYKPENGPHQSISSDRIIKSTWRGSTYDRIPLLGYRVIGSYGAKGDRNKGTISVQVKRGESLLYQKGPGMLGQKLSLILGDERRLDTLMPDSLDGWSVLDFSDAALPEEFTVVIADESGKFGEWAAVAFTSEVKLND